MSMMIVLLTPHNLIKILLRFIKNLTCFIKILLYFIMAKKVVTISIDAELASALDKKVRGNRSEWFSGLLRRELGFEGVSGLEVRVAKLEGLVSELSKGEDHSRGSKGPKIMGPLDVPKGLFRCSDLPDSPQDLTYEECEY